MTDIVIGSLDEIPVGEGRSFALDGEQIAVFRLRDGSVCAIDAVCPHKGGPLADGLADDRVVVCPLHGYTFDLRTGKEVSGAQMGVRSHPVALDDRSIRITRPG